MIDDDDDVLPTTNKQKSTTSNNNDDDCYKSTIHSLHKMGIDILEPTTKKEILMARAMDAFSTFVLHDERTLCQSIIDKHIADGNNNAGILAGGSDSFEIYRLSITDDSDVGAAHELLQSFHASREGRRYATILTMDKLKTFLLSTCDRRSTLRGDCKKYNRLGNVMFILAFGPTDGQVRHIDNMLPNLQICCYMSRDCPSTIAYDTESEGSSGGVTNARDLLAFWAEGGGNNDDDGIVVPSIPPLLATILDEKGDINLGDAAHTRYFSFWKSIDDNLRCFGKLYRPVSRRLFLEATDPGTTLIAGGNDIHAGPPTTHPRMFAFAIGIPEDDFDGSHKRRKQRRRGNEENNNDNDDDDQNDGEVQYNPVLLHLDLCCILFAMMDFEYSSKDAPAAARREAKRFLLDRLVALAKEYPKESYGRLLGDDRSEIRDWMGRLVRGLGRQKKQKQTIIDGLMEEAVESESLFYGPDVSSSKTTKQQRRRRRRKKAMRDGRER